MFLYNINYFIKKIREIDRVNKTHKKYISLVNDFNIYIKNEKSIKELSNKLVIKSSCIPYLLDKIYINNKKEILKIIEKINIFLIDNNYNNEYITNYLVNILSNNNTKIQFICGLKNKDLFNDTIFRNLLDENFEKYSKFEVINKNIIENIFYKIIEKPKHLSIFLDSLKLKNYNIFTNSNDFLKKKDIFYKNILIIFIEIFTKKHSFYIYNKNKYINDDSFLIFKKIFELIEYICNELQEEYIYLNQQNLVLDLDTKQEDIYLRQKNILSILNNNYLLDFNKSFFETSLLLLVKIKEKTLENENFIKIIKNYYSNNINFILITKNIYILISNIINFDISNDYNLIIDYFFLTNKLISKENPTKFSKFYFYISKIINNIFKSFSIIYDKIKNENYLVFDLIIEICNFLNITLFKYNNYRRLFCYLLEKNIFYLKKFCCVLLEIILFNIEKLKYSFENNHSTYTKLYFETLNILFTSFNRFTKYYRNIIFCDELKKLYNQVIEFFIENINKIYNDNNPLVKKTSINIFILIKDSIIEIDNINFFNNIDFSILKLKLLEHNKININQIVFFNKSKPTKKQNYDDKFCDPITNNLIDIPIMIPQNVIVDKNMIYRYLLTNNSNPYNRCELNFEILNKYNNDIDVKEKINRFTIELQNYKNTL